MPAIVRTRRGPDPDRKLIGGREMVFRDTTTDDETPFIEVSVRLSNGHFETTCRSSLGDKEGARELVEAWVGAIDAVLPRLPKRSR